MIDTIDTIDKLEALAAWHRLNAAHAGSTWVWDARPRTPAGLEPRAAELRAHQGGGHRAGQCVQAAWWPGLTSRFS